MSSNSQLPGGAIDAKTLSQLMDGEWHEVDRSACVAGICDDQVLRSTWARWHVARDALRGESLIADAALCDRIRQAIDGEASYSNVIGIGGSAGGVSAHDAQPVATVLASVARPRTRLRQGATGFGLAAGVAIATVFGLDAWRGDAGIGGADGDAGSAVQIAQSATAVAPGPSVVNASQQLPQVELVGHSGSFWVSDSPEGTMQRSASEQRLNMFLSQHLEQSPNSVREGLLPYSRLVGYDERGRVEGR